MKKVRGFTLVELLVVISIIAMLLAVLLPSLQKAREIAKRAICGTQIKQIGVGLMAYVSDNDDALPAYGYKQKDGHVVVEDESTTHPYAVYRCDHGNNDVGFQDASQNCVCGTAGKPLPMRLGALYAAKVIKDAKLFYCPANTNKEFRYDSYSQVTIKSDKGPKSKEWGKPHQAYNLEASPAKNDWIRVGYAYYPIDESTKGVASMMKPVNGMQIPRYTARKFAKLDRRAPYCTDVIWQRKDIVHKDGMDKSSNRVKNAGLDALFKDGHAKFIKDQPITYTDRGVEYNERLLDNRFWNSWDPPRAEDKPDDVDASYILYNTYRFIN